MDNLANQNVYFNQCSTNYQITTDIYMPGDYVKQEIYPSLKPAINMYSPVEQERIIRNGSCHPSDIPSAPQYHTIQYTPLIPKPVPYHQQQQSQQYSNFMAKRHHAQITFVPTSRGNFKAVVKRKRKRTVFTTEQIEALENIFKIKQYITREDRQDIVKQLQLSDKAVKIWFQNRRLKIKRMSDSGELEDGSSRDSIEKRTYPDITRLDFVESKINKKTDEFGYVTLDDSVMEDLVSVVDDFLATRNLNVPAEEAMASANNSQSMYEPISPASITDSNDEEHNSYWKPSEPNESLQRLFDLQSLISS